MLKTKRHRLKQAANSKKKKKVGRFYKWSFLISLISFITLFYFLVLVSIAPKSFPYVTQKIQTYLKENVDQDASIKESYLSFTRYGTFKIAVDDLKFFYKSSGEEEKQELIIPKFEAEISLLNLLRFRMTPSKIKIVDPEIIINNTENKNSVAGEDLAASVEKSKTNFISTIITAIKSKSVPIRNFEIENAKLLVKGKVIDTEILIKKSKIKSRFRKGILTIYSVNNVSFDKNKPDVKFNSNCQLQDDDSLKCGLSLMNFETQSIVNLHPKLKILEQVNSSFNVTASLTINEDGLSSFVFKTSSAKGSFDSVDFFTQKMNFSNLSVAGEYHKDLGVFTLSEINADLPNPQILSHLQMSAAISNLNDPQNIKSDFEIKLQNVPNDEMEKFWPKQLHHSGIRDWVIKHVKGGVIKDAYAKFTLQKSDGNEVLENIESKVTFSGLNLSYSESFPQITNIEAIANFSKNDMKIDIVSADVLGSKISDSQVVIPDFHASPPMLRISGKSHGAASDSLKHAHNDKDFAAKVEEYLNGDSQNRFDIRIPLSNKITLEKTYIEVNSAISNLKNDYLEGAIKAVTKKDFASSDFITSVNFIDAKLTHKAFDIEKDLLAEGALDVTISFSEPKKIWFKDINLWKKESAKSGQIISSKISGNVAFNIEKSQISYLKLKNNNFGKNNYSIFYAVDEEKSSKKVVINGKLINLGSLIENKFSSGKSSKEKVLNSDYRISVKKLLLANNKSIRGLNISLDCDNKLCHTGLVDGFYDQKDYISLKIFQKSSDSAEVKGRITNIGYLSEALNISNKVSSGKADIDLINKIIDGNQITEGEINIENGITIFESAEVKRLSTDTLFSTVKDKIFSSEKIIFDSLKIEISLQDQILNIKSLIANNYKIGITAKGKINLAESSYEIKGMIIPGFIINNLFGIGKIPILGMVTGLLTGGEGGGVFGIGYEYIKNKGDKEAQFKTHKVSAFVPTTIRNLFDAI